MCLMCPEKARNLRDVGLLKREERLYVVYVSVCHCGEVGQISLLLLGLLGQDVTLEGVLSLDLS